MPISLIRISTRITTDVPFYTMPPEFDQHMQVTYEDPGHRTMLVISLSADGLVETRKSTWSTAAVLHDTLADMICYSHICMMDDYNTAHGITVEQSVTEG